MSAWKDAVDIFNGFHLSVVSNKVHRGKKFEKAKNCIGAVPEFYYMDR
jgi:hypothetical protein